MFWKAYEAFRFAHGHDCSKVVARTKWAKSIEYIECQKFDDHNKDERLNLSKTVSKTVSKTISTVSKTVILFIILIRSVFYLNSWYDFQSRS